MPKSVSVVTFVSAIVAASAASLLGLYLYQPEVQSASLVGPLLLSLVALLGSLLNYRVRGGGRGNVSFIPNLAALVLYPSWATVVIAGACVGFVHFVTPMPALKRFFNVSQTVLAGCAATMAYVALGGVGLVANPEFPGLPLFASVTLWLLVNTVSVATAIGLAEKKSIYRTWQEGNSAGLLYDLASIPVVYAFARVYVDWGGWGIVSLCALVVGLRLTYQSKHQLQTTNKELLELFVQTVEFRDPYTSGHSQRVSRYSRIIADIVGITKAAEVERIATAALLHDVGKIHEIFAPILSKPGRLTPEERAIMQLHPIKSAELVERISHLQDVIPAVRHHHENWDGTGYPHRLAGKAIPLGSRIIMIADTIDAMTTDRPYRKALGEAQVRAEIKKLQGIQFDPHICALLVASPDFGRLFNQNDDGRAKTVTQIFSVMRKRMNTPAVA
jgi:putative nucleotidyltransferase with HDIG domain